jgi:drug/metabolite transporter (DMT)-like permease
MSTVRRPQNLRHGVGWMILACLCFGAMWGTIRLGSHELHAFQLVFGRNFFGLLFMLPWILATRGIFLRTQSITPHLQRATSGVLATFGAFYAVSHAPMATAISINYTAPLFATVGAVLFLGERIRMRRILALCVGFCGMLLVVRPGSLPFTPGIAAAVLSAVATAFTIIAVRRLTATEDWRAIVFFSFALMLPFSVMAAASVWRAPDAGGWAILALIGLEALIAQIAMVRAYEVADASALMPYDFVRFGTVISIGVLGFGEAFDLWSLLGGALILVSTIYLAHREKILGKARRTPADG